MFATDYGMTDPTFYSHKFMAEPLSSNAKETLKFKTTNLFENDATKNNLKDAFAKRNPALIYIASHGIGAQGEDLSVQKRYNGAVCCQELGANPNVPPQEGIFSADDVPAGGTCAEGAVIFDFSCYGYGTPAQSDFYHWTTEHNIRVAGSEKFNSSEDFIAALPKKLLAHPNGPIGFFGHVDTAWLSGFADPENPYTLQRWSSRMGPFKNAVEAILKQRTLGMVLYSMNEKLKQGNEFLVETYDRVKSGRENMASEKKAVFVEEWITRTDAANYMLFGDPATRVRLPSSSTG
jgi:hypothetical protein